MQESRQLSSHEGRWRVAAMVVFVTGLGLQLLFWLRAIWIYRDQVELYRLGIELATAGAFNPFGKLMTGNYPIPGVFLQSLIGLPLLVWHDYRAPTLVLQVFHLAAALLLSRLLFRDFGWRVATLFLALFWLSPWRLYHSGFLWEANYVFLPAALHFWACRAQRAKGRFAPSLLLGLTLLLTAQVHGSMIILLLTTVMLLWRRGLHLHLVGAGTGAVLGGLPLLPTLAALATGASNPVQPTSMVDWLARLNSLEKGLLYWLRLSSLDIGRRFRQLLFCHYPGTSNEVHQPVLCALTHLTEILAVASIVLSALASWWFLSHRLQEGLALQPIASWYRTYCGAMLLALALAALLSPVLLQGWHLLIAMPAACLPVALWIAVRWRTGGLFLRTMVIVFVLWRLPASLQLAFGHPMYATPAAPEQPRHIVPQDLQSLLGGHSPSP